MLDAEKLRIRKSGLGGSEIAALVGLSKYKTPLDVYLDKINPEVEEQTINDAIHFGNLLEDTVAYEYARRTGNSVTQEPETLRHPEYNFALANIDGWVNNKEFILECKTTHFINKDQWGEEYTDQIPDSYLIQCAWYAFVCDKPKVDIAVLIGGQLFKIYTYIRNATLEQNLIAVAQDFWVNNVLAKNPPMPSTLPEVARVYSADNGSNITADDSIKNKLESLTQLKAQLKELEDQTKSLQLDIQNYMGEHASIVDESNLLLATWKLIKSKTAFDSNKFKAEHPELYNQYLTSGKAYRTFLIKNKTENNSL